MSPKLLTSLKKVLKPSKSKRRQSKGNNSNNKGHRRNRSKGSLDEDNSGMPDSISFTTQSAPMSVAASSAVVVEKDPAHKLAAIRGSSMTTCCSSGYISLQDSMMKLSVNPIPSHEDDSHTSHTYNSLTGDSYTLATTTSCSPRSPCVLAGSNVAREIPVIPNPEDDEPNIQEGASQEPSIHYGGLTASATPSMHRPTRSRCQSVPVNSNAHMVPLVATIDDMNDSASCLPPPSLTRSLTTINPTPNATTVTPDQLPRSLVEVQPQHHKSLSFRLRKRNRALSDIDFDFLLVQSKNWTVDPSASKNKMARTHNDRPKNKAFTANDFERFIFQDEQVEQQLEESRDYNDTNNLDAENHTRRRRHSYQVSELVMDHREDHEDGMDDDVHPLYRDSQPLSASAMF